MLSKEQLTSMRDRCTTDLREILDFFADRSTDPAGGFYGKVGRDLVPVYDAPRALVYVGRMLWTYAAAYRILGEDVRRGEALEKASPESDQPDQTE